MSIEQIILGNLAFNEKYARKVVAFLKDDYFSEQSEKTVYQLIDAYIKKYNDFPSKEALLIDLSNKDGVSEDTFEECKNIIVELEPSSAAQSETAWLLDQTEKFCQDKAIYNAVYEAINIISGKDKNLGKGSLPKLLSDALAVSFDTHIGHDFLEDAEARFESYQKTEERIPFDLEFMNNITKGGLPPKTLNVILAGTGVGKSLFMAHMAAHHLAIGKNVLYITLEMSEEEISKRIDANLLNIPIGELMTVPKDMYLRKVDKLRSKTQGKLVVKEYPTASAGSANFRHLLQELRLKKNFVPDIIYIDYINICISSRLKNAQNVNSFFYVKAIAEELRGLGVEFNVPIVSATQTTRGGFNNSDPGLEDTAESFGLPATADFMGVLISTDELQEMGQVIFKQLKNRYDDKGRIPRFVLGVDKVYMRFYDVNDTAQNNIGAAPVADNPVMDNTEAGDRINNDSKPAKKKPKFFK